MLLHATEVEMSEINAAAAANARQTFTHALTIYLKDSNAYGNTYFARYFEWQGICREKVVLRFASRATCCKKRGGFITKHAEQDYLQETFPFQDISCEMNTFDVKKCSFWLEFRFYADGKAVSVGRQQIVFRQSRQADHGLA